MAQQFIGAAEIVNNASGLPALLLEGGGDESGGNIRLGGNGQIGDVTLVDPSGKQRAFIQRVSSLEQKDASLESQINTAISNLTARVTETEFKIIGLANLSHTHIL